MNSVQRDPVVGVLVTHNSQQFLVELLDSIDSQTRPLDQLIVIDDNSTDSTRSILSERGITAIASTSAATDPWTRIASNFLQGVRCAPPESIVILGDHDDTWLPNRVEHQSRFLSVHSDIAFLASDGYTTTTQTLRSTFPVPPNFNELTRKDQWRYVSRHSVATGGASAMVPSRLTTVAIPNRWLHDRWWSARAVREGVMATDTTVVINYRLSDTQQVGLSTRGQGSLFSSVLYKFNDIPSNLKKMKDILRLLAETH